MTGGLAFDAAWATARCRAVVAGAGRLVAEAAAGPKQRHLLETALRGLRARQAAPGALLPSVHLPLLVAAHGTGDDAPALPVAVLTAILELGMDLADELADEELAPHWAGLPAKAAAMAASLLISALPMRAVRAMPVPAERRLEMLDVLSRQGLLIAQGQQADVMLTRAPAPDPEAVARSNLGKTGERRALYGLLAARFAGLPPAAEAGLAAMARALGQASQLENDLHDLIIESPSRDLGNGTRTWPIAWALGRVEGDARVMLLEALEAATRPGADHGHLQAWLRGLGVVRRTELEIAYHAGCALTALESSGAAPATASALAAMIETGSLAPEDA